jgi:AraC-like DNA-binding protein/mannose-6-phosphate isomerase-like protein (cupin superfamily)
MAAPALAGPALAAPALASSRFATAQLPEDPAERVERWEEHNARSLIALECRPPHGGSFDAVEDNLQLDRVHLARVRGTAHEVQRSAGVVESHPAGSIAVYATLRGEALVEHDGRRRLLRPGQLLVCDADQPFVRGFGHGLDELAVKVPRASVAELTGGSGLPSPLVVEAGDTHGRALTRLVGRALRAPHPVPAEERAVVELVSVLAGRVSTAVEHRVTARAYVEEHLVDPGLAAPEVAAATGVSERTLTRVFADVGTSVPRHILGRRLDAAYALLVSRPDLRTGEVAARCGFVSPAWFSRTFRARFGVTAGQVRRHDAS